MAVFKKCDVCGDYYDPTNSDSTNGIAFCRLKNISYGVLNINETLDCCDNCLKAIKDFIYERRENKNAYYFVNKKR